MSVLDRIASGPQIVKSCRLGGSGQVMRGKCAKKSSRPSEKTGVTLASNLGVVELTLALHAVF